MSDERTLESQCYGECWAAKEEIADKDAQLCRLHADNERLREELRQSSIDHTRAEVERLKGLLLDIRNDAQTLHWHETIDAELEQEPPR